MNAFKGLLIHSVLIVFAALLIFSSCHKKDPTLPVVETTDVANITALSAVSGGDVLDNGSEEVTDRGVCWSEEVDPTIENTKTHDGVGKGVFISTLSDLQPGVNYYVRAYATSGVGTSYGLSVSFATASGQIDVSTADIEEITSSSAVAGGHITSDGGDPITIRGVVWGISDAPTTSENIGFTTDGSGIGEFSSNITGLSSATAYFVRAYATNSIGTAYGQSISFTTTADNSHMLLGNPSSAVPSMLSENNYLMTKTQYDLSYNSSKRTANWVSWHLNSTYIGNAPRQNDFRADFSLPASWYRVGSTEYSGSGFDRGHLCPSADRTLTVVDNSATFFMTNMMPQSPINNQQTWAHLEEYSRYLVSQGNELYIIAGPHGQGGTGSKGYANLVNNQVVVPSHVWKIIVVLPDGNSDLSRITTNTRVIAVIMPNTQDVNSNPWHNYRVSVNDVEVLTGYDFLSNVPEQIQAVIEENPDNTSI